MRPTSLVAISLALATAVNVTAILKARAEGQATVWIQFATSAYGNTVQHITTARYLAPSMQEAMTLCEIDRQPIINGFAREGLHVIVDPECVPNKPWSWIE